MDLDISQIEVLPSELIDFLSQFPDSYRLCMSDVETFFEEMLERQLEQQEPRTDGEWV